MIRIQNPDFDLKKIAESGQCFRLNPNREGDYTLVALGRVLRLRETADGCELDCSSADFDALWRGYFDLERDYAAIRASVDPDDAFLNRACDFGRGIRMLRQEPWEMLISFILSQQKNIPAIKRCVEVLCSRYGEPIENAGDSLFSFPSAGRLAALDERCLLDCSLGYRAKYVSAAARLVASGALNLTKIATLPDDALMEALLAVPGVGEKVANCVLLFGYHRLGRFPRDVWINRVIENEYGGLFPLARYPDTAGALQQYIFYYARSGSALNQPDA